VLIGADLAWRTAPEGRGCGSAFRSGVCIWRSRRPARDDGRGPSPPDLRGTAFGFFNLVSGIAMLAASALAGALWDVLGARSTFQAGAGFCALALVAIALRPRSAGMRG
jgi:MFS family permease